MIEIRLLLCFLSFQLIIVPLFAIQQEAIINQDGSNNNYENDYMKKFPLPVREYLNKIKGKNLQQDDDQLYYCSIVSYYTKGVGLGIYAGRTFRVGDIIDMSPGIPVLSKSILSKVESPTVLSYYVEEFNKTHALAALGYAMLYNHAPLNFTEPMINKVFPPKESFTPQFNFHDLEGQTEDVHYVASRDILPGEQIFGFYGQDWFKKRKMEEISPDILEKEYISVGRKFITTSDMKRLPGCASSMTYFRNEKLYASRFIHAGEIIEVTRALLILESAVKDSPLLQRFLWYRNKDAEMIMKSTVGLETSENEKHVLLPLGKGSLYTAPDLGDAPNVYYSWYDADNLIDDFEPLASKQQCKDRMFISFKAIRNIQPGESLTIDIEFDNLTRHRSVTVKFSKFCLFDKLVVTPTL